MCQDWRIRRPCGSVDPSFRRHEVVAQQPRLGPGCVCEATLRSVIESDRP